MPEPKARTGDITYIRTTAGWRYLAVSHLEVRWANWINLYSRRVVGWTMGTTMVTTLLLEALNRAMAYRQLLENHKISCSMSAKGCCWDNAVVESFFSTLKHELGLDAEILNSPQQLIRHLAFWIDGYYNRERRHSTIGYISPNDYEQQLLAPVHSNSWSPDTCPLNRGNPTPTSRDVWDRTCRWCRGPSWWRSGSMPSATARCSALPWATARPRATAQQ